MSRYHENLKEVLNTKEAAGEAAKAEAAAKKYADEEIAKLSFDEAGAAAAAAAQALADAKADAASLYQVKGDYEEAGAAAEALEAAQEYADGLATNYDAAGSAAAALADAKAYADGLAKNYDAAGAAAQALTDAKADAASLYQVKGDYEAAGTAAGLNDAMDKRVKVLEAIDHDKLAADASAAAVATVLDGAPDKFDTLKEVAQWIADSESATTAADLVTRVKALEDIDHNAYVAADELNLNADKAYADTVAGNCDIKGAAAQALADAKTYVDGKLVFAEDADIDALFA